MAKWHKKTLKLKSSHTWKAKPGHKIFMMDHGAVRFDIPVSWVVDPNAKSIKLYNKQPPADDCLLEVSHLPLPPMDWSGLPLPKLLEESMKGDASITQSGDILEIRRNDLEIAWRESRFIDENEERKAISRLCMARRNRIVCIITFAYWESDAAWCIPVWDTVLETLRLGDYIQDPTSGRRVS